MDITNYFGYLLINKPKGLTSHDAVNFLRRITGIKKIGHSGTLDPFAWGVLLAGIGRTATRYLANFARMDKKYRAVLKLGYISDTYDLTGRIKRIATQEFATKKQEVKIQKVLESFIGRQKQIPPNYSAKKIKGKKAYELARKGENITLQPQEIEIYDIKLLSNIAYQISNMLVLDIYCSTGTYIRSLAHDIGQKLKCGAYLEDLVRLSVDNFTLEESLNLISKPNTNTPLIKSLNFKSNLTLTKHNWRKYLIRFQKVLCFGTFDILHSGHFYFLKQAKQMGNFLTVIVARDKTSSLIKKRKPIYSEKVRLDRLKKISFLDKIYLGDAKDPYKCLKIIKPDLICLGYDQTSFTGGLSEKIFQLNLKTKICRLSPFKPEKYKTVLLRHKYGD